MFVFQRRTELIHTRSLEPTRLFVRKRSPVARPFSTLCGPPEQGCPRRRSSTGILTSSLLDLPGRWPPPLASVELKNGEKQATPGAKWLAPTTRPRLSCISWALLRGSTEFPPPGAYRRAMLISPVRTSSSCGRTLLTYHGRRLAQRPELPVDPLLRHRTVLPTARRQLAPVWPRRAAASVPGWSYAVRGSRDRAQCSSCVPEWISGGAIFVKAVLRTSGRRRPVRWYGIRANG